MEFSKRVTCRRLMSTSLHQRQDKKGRIWEEKLRSSVGDLGDWWPNRQFYVIVEYTRATTMHNFLVESGSLPAPKQLGRMWLVRVVGVIAFIDLHRDNSLAWNSFRFLLSPVLFSCSPISFAFIKENDWKLSTVVLGEGIAWEALFSEGSTFVAIC